MHPPLSSARRSRKLLARCSAFAVAAGLTAGMLGAAVAPAAAGVTPASAADPDLASRFTLAVLPDTQFYSRYSADQFMPRYGTDPFADPNPMDS